MIHRRQQPCLRVALPVRCQVTSTQHVSKIVQEKSREKGPCHLTRSGHMSPNTNPVRTVGPERIMAEGALAISL
jgi:hypothetical protein